MGAQCHAGRVLIGITGAQGVGKSTFCSALFAELQRNTRAEVRLAFGLGERLKAGGIALGSAASRDSIAAVYAAHLERELGSDSGVILLDRCAVDALAYVRSLRVSSDAESALYAKLSMLMTRSLALVVHLEMRGIFATSSAQHETTTLRGEVARLIPQIIEELGIDHISLYAADPSSIAIAAEKIIKVAGVPLLGSATIAC